jgi:predicted dehydrogenase
MSFPSHRTSRRSFLRQVTITTAGGIVLPSFLRAQESAPAGRKVNVAGIGVGGKGGSDIQFAGQTNNVVAICDVDAKTLAKAAMKYPNAKQFRDFRKMLDEVKEIEAVTISTPDHAHYPAAMHAMALGKHVCIQKPLTNTLWEAHELHKAAKKKGVITQMGNQGHTFEENRLLKEWLQAGVIGTVREAHVWTNRPIWPQGNAVTWKSGTPPEELDWELWQAQCPDRPFSSDVHPFKWRGFVEYGAGALGDMGCHNLDPIFQALDLGVPDRVEAKAEELTDIAWPRGAVVKYTWNKVPKHGSFSLYWYEGKNEDGSPKLPPAPKEMGEKPLSKTGFLLIGADGLIANEGDQAKKMTIYPEERGKDFLANPPAKTLPRSPNPGQPQQEWISAIREGKEFPFMSRFDYSVPLTELCLLGALAMQCGRPIEWNSKKLEVTGMPEAAKYIKRQAYRKGWEYSSDKI